MTKSPAVLFLEKIMAKPPEIHRAVFKNGSGYAIGSCGWRGRPAAYPGQPQGGRL